jgi:hypothetical protein
VSTAGNPARAPAPRALLGRVWVATFLYAALAAVLVQLVVLPHLLPAWHAGSGLLVGGDWIAFHNYAVRHAARIQAQGWSAFELRPRGNAPIGIASAVYALTWPRPWTLIPLNAALHATAAALLCHLLRAFVADWRWAVLGTAPFVLYPTALLWVSQIHKDGAFILGYLCLFDAWVGLARRRRGPGGVRALVRALSLVLIGFGLVWVVRPDLVIVTQAATALAFGVLVIAAGVRVWSGRLGWRRAAGILGFAGLVTLAAAWMTGSTTRFLGHPSQWSARLGSDVAASLPPGASKLPPGAGDLGGAVRAIPWDRTAWLPLSLDRVAYRIALVREISLVYYRDSLTNMDLGVGFYRVTDVLRYVPRALQIALLAPFPATWGDPGSSAWTTVSRRIVALEMVGIYLALLGLAASLWGWRRRPELWVVLLPCLAVLALYTLAVPNLGTLHRFRYGFLMTLCGVGIAGGLEMLSARAHGPGSARPGDAS